MLLRKIPIHKKNEINMCLHFKRVEDLNEFIKKVDIILQDYEKWPEKCIKVAKRFSNSMEGLSWLNLVESIDRLNSM